MIGFICLGRIGLILANSQPKVKKKGIIIIVILTIRKSFF